LLRRVGVMTVGVWGRIMLVLSLFVGGDLRSADLLLRSVKVVLRAPLSRALVIVLRLRVKGVNGVVGRGNVGGTFEYGLEVCCWIDVRSESEKGVFNLTCSFPLPAPQMLQNSPSNVCEQVSQQGLDPRIPSRHQYPPPTQIFSPSPENSWT
jgi:hypothetical protein